MSLTPPFAGPAPGALTRTLLAKLDATPSIPEGRWSVPRDARRALGWVISVLEQDRLLRPQPPAELEQYVRKLAPTLGRMRGTRDHRGLLASLRVLEARLEREPVD